MSVVSIGAGELYNSSLVTKWERFYGNQFTSTGGYEAAKEFCKLIKLEPKDYVLDIACGLGGNAFHMAEYYGCKVLGIDLSPHMINTANEYLKKQSKQVQDKVTLKAADIESDSIEFDDGTFSAIFSKETVMHIFDKQQLFCNLYKWLAPGGRMMVIDYCLGENSTPCKVLHEYITRREYKIKTISTLHNYLTVAGFKDIQPTDISSYFVDYCKKELEDYEKNKQKFQEEFGEEEYKKQVVNVNNKLGWCKTKQFAYGMLIARK